MGREGGRGAGEGMEWGRGRRGGEYRHFFPYTLSTEPDHPFVGRRNEYQQKGGDALRLGSKGRYGSCVGGR